MYRAGFYRTVIPPPLTTLYGRTRDADFGAPALKAVRQPIIDADLCRRTIDNRINSIRRVFKWSVENEFVPPTFTMRPRRSRRSSSGAATFGRLDP